MIRDAFDAVRVRKNFPALNQKIYGKPLVYLDNAATTQKPKSVIDALEQYYSSENANIHRGIYYLSQQATNAYEGVRARVRQFLNARSSEEIIFVRGATEGINLVAQSYGRTYVKEGDEIVVSVMEHHSNIVPWQMLCDEAGARLRVIPINDEGEILTGEYENLLNERTKLVSIAHVSNVIGTLNPVKEMVEKAHGRGIPVLVDGAQAVPHLKVDVQDLDCDFLVFSGHKMFGPTGVGVLYGKSELLEKMPPYQGGGDMISSVTFEKTVYNKIPYKFEAGTPHIAGVIGLGRAIDYLNEIGMEEIAAYEEELLRVATEALGRVPGLRLIGTARKKSAIVSFVLKEVHPHDIGTILDRQGVAIRAGHHCAMPLMQRFGVPATARASFAFYNTKEDVDALCRALGKVREVFK
ncbi:MAG: cysteine desulfurase [Candidatus Omnitrophica bacterium]|nr:cysteine desulfurase [Candidatus Omnitrophota bacterium]